MGFDKQAWLDRAATFSVPSGKSLRAEEAAQFATSMATALYGKGSPQLALLEKRIQGVFAKEKESGIRFGSILYSAALGAITNMEEELRLGLISNLRLDVAGEIFADTLATARSVLAIDNSHVAAVLVAVSFEDTIRRLALEKHGLVEREKLEKVIGILKEAGTFKGGEAVTANSFLKFRNDALHADWEKVQSTQTEACLAFTESLIQLHFRST